MPVSVERRHFKKPLESYRWNLDVVVVVLISCTGEKNQQEMRRSQFFLSAVEQQQVAMSNKNKLFLCLLRLFCLSSTMKHSFNRKMNYERINNSLVQFQFKHDRVGDTNKQKNNINFNINNNNFKLQLGYYSGRSSGSSIHSTSLTLTFCSIETKTSNVGC